jgi:branched-chain amino acid transport system permease protein
VRGRLRAPLGAAGRGRYRVTAFGVSAGLSGLGGAIAALLGDFIAADGYTVFFSILLLVGAMAGGITSVWGALAGGLLVEFLPDLAGDASAALSFPMFGVVLILLVWLLPEGLVPAAERALRRLGG